MSNVRNGAISETASRCFPMLYLYSYRFIERFSFIFRFLPALYFEFWKLRGVKQKPDEVNEDRAKDNCLCKTFFTFAELFRYVPTVSSGMLTIVNRNAYIHYCMSMPFAETFFFFYFSFLRDISHFFVLNLVFFESRRKWNRECG